MQIKIIAKKKEFFMYFRQYCFACFMLLLCTITLTCQNFMDQFQANLTSNIKIISDNKENDSSSDSPQKTKLLTAIINYGYSHKYLGSDLFIQLDTLQTQALVDQQTVKDVIISKDGMKVWIPKKNQWQEISTEKSEGVLKQQLQDCFNKPLCKIAPNAEGKRVLEASKEPGARGMIENGMIENIRLFHSTFYNDKAEWKNSTTMSMGNGAFATGELTYRKIPNTDLSLQKVEINGTLQGDMNHPPFQIKGAKYQITGSQEYNTSLQEWTSGKFDIQVTLSATVETRKIQIQGFMSWSFKHQSRSQIK